MVNSINLRIRELRKQIGLNQDTFGQRIGLKHGAVSRMEKPGNMVIAQNIRLICDVYKVNEQWLLTGEGEMRRANNESVFRQFAAEYNLEGERLELVKSFLKLTVEQQEVIVHSTKIIAEVVKRTFRTCFRSRSVSD